MSIPTREGELLAVALRIERDYGSNGLKVIAERIGSAARESDVEQLDFWKAVAAKYQILRDKPSKKKIH